MNAAVDPTYPLLPVACFLSATMLLFVLLTSFIRQSWNLGVAFLCFWMFWENVTLGANTIIWSDNADIKHYIYCDIITHVQLIAAVVRPMATLIITRQLYLITSLQSVELSDKAADRRNLAIQWTLGLAVPMLVAGPAYYIVQQVRFSVYEGLGCQASPDESLLAYLLIFSWSVIPPLLSVIIYYPRVIRILYRQKRDMNRFLQSNNSLSRVNYFRIFALASIDILVTLPFGIVDLALHGTESLAQLGHKFILYSGWTFLHADWEPVAYSYADLVAGGTSTMARLYFAQWSSPALAFVIFGLFGVTAEARASYWLVICAVGGRFGWKPTSRTRKAPSPMGTMEFGKWPQDMSFNLDIELQPSYINPKARAEQVAESGGKREPPRELESGSHSEIVEELRAMPSDAVNTGYHGEHEPDGVKSADASDAV